MVALQSCVGFCYTAQWISSVYTYLPSFLDLLPVSPAHSSQSNERSSLHYMAEHIHPSQSPSSSYPPPPSPHTRSLRLHLYSCPANRFTCTIFLASTITELIWRGKFKILHPARNNLTAQFCLCNSASSLQSHVGYIVLGRQKLATMLAAETYLTPLVSYPAPVPLQNHVCLCKDQASPTAVS